MLDKILPAGLDAVLFIVLPYLSLVLFFLVTIQRYRKQTFTYSSLSSQFLENRHHFWGLVPFHYGLLIIIAGHVIGFLVPGWVIAWNADMLRLWILEVTALVGGFLTLVGFVNIVVRRFRSPKVRVVTTAADWVLYGMLFVQFATGVYTAVFARWGSSWYASNAVPYLRSLFMLAPDLGFVAPLPILVKAHLLCAFLIVAFFPFTRLVHILVVPNPYLWRRPQVVRWYGRRRADDVR